MAAFGPDASEGDLLTWIFTYAWDQDMSKEILFDVDHNLDGVTLEDAKSTILEIVAGIRRKLVGSPKGQVISMIMHNSVWYPLFALGIIGSGAVYSGVNPTYTSDELQRYLEVVRPTMIITELELLEKLCPALDALDFPTDRVFVDKTNRTEWYPDNTLPEHNFYLHADLLFRGDAHWLLFDDDEEACHYPAALYATSGTTGHPKYAVKTHRNLINDGVCIVERKPYRVKRLISLPLFHAFAAPLGIIDAIAKAIPTYIMRRFEMDQFLDILVKHDITETVVVPKLVKLFTTLPVERRLVLGKLQTVICAGAPLPRAVQNEGRRLLAHNGRLVQCWGMTETGWITTFLYPDTDISGSVGKLLPFVELAIVDSEYRRVEGEKTPGELLVRSPSVMKEYLNDKIATQQSKVVLCDGTEWLKTGDLGYMRNEKVYITGRIKELIKINGWQVSPTEIEDVLASHSLIKDCGVVGITQPDKMNERVFIRVVIHDDVTKKELPAEAIRKYLLARLASYKVKDADIGHIAEIPRNASGKILRKELVDQIRKEHHSISGGMHRTGHYCTVM